MRYQDSWRREITRRRRLRNLRTALRIANRRRARLRKVRRADVDTSWVQELKRKRAIFVRQFYRRRYKRKPETVRIEGAFGLESPSDVDRFLSTASALVDFEARRLTIDFTACTRVWPSAVTLLCSLAKWTELAATQQPPRIGSFRPVDASVESYLQDCGFYDFVGVEPIHLRATPAATEVVRIRRELSPSAIEEREAEIRTMLYRHARLTNEEIELFDSIVLTEVFNNVTEHGVARHEQGWWIMAQYHPTHRIISLCIADNGIGIRHTLSTGPQGEAIRARLGPDAKDDEYIRLALDENVSGAIDAGTRSKPLIGPERYKRGSQRGYGLRRIRDTCRELEVPFWLISQRGFAGIAPDGTVDRSGSHPTRVFAGTLYHFVLPAQEVRDESH